jgi:GNAT superfamily N-acetyltransferase
MSITFRTYQTPDDFDHIGDFLVTNYQPRNRDGNWLQPTWEYMHGHSYLDKQSLHKIGIWEEAGNIVSVVHYESQLGEVFFELAPGYDYLKPVMLDYAEANLYGTNEEGKRFVRAYVNSFDADFEAEVKTRGYELDAPWSRPVSQFTIPTPFPEIPLPEGFRVQSLADDCDWAKIHRVLWRGFNHEGDPPADGIADRKLMESVPNYRRELKIVTVAPDGNFVSFCGMWYDAVNKLAYVEPVATDPAWRRMGLGRAAVWEGIRRCGELGATVAFVGSDQEFYKAIGFEVLFRANCWLKCFS